MLDLVLLLLLKHGAPGAVPAKELAPAIIAISEQYNLDPIQVTQIILVESKGKANAINKTSHDYGLMQIHDVTAKAYGASKTCLMLWRCNLGVGVLILSDLSRTCRYNVGSGPLLGRKLTNCLTYEHKLANIK